MPAYGEANIKVTAGRTILVLVEDIFYDFILGLDVMGKFRFILDIKIVL